MGKKSKRDNKRTKTKVGAGFYVFLTVMVFIAVTAASTAVRNSRENAKIAASGTKLYFFDTQQNLFKFENRQIPDGGNTDKVKFVLEELVVGPKNTILSESVPADIIKSATISGTNVDVELSNNYNRLISSEEIICRAAIVCSLTELEFVDTVSINIEGSELLKPNGQPYGKIKAEDIVVSPDLNPPGGSYKTLTLYFADSENTGLVAESRTVLTKPNDPVEKSIVEELIRGPVSSNLLPTVPPDTKLLKITVQDGVCSVDLSRDFISKHTGAPGTERLSIYSIVNSLCEQSDIKSVAFQIESKRLEQFKNETGFNNIYEATDLPPAGADETEQ